MSHASLAAVEPAAANAVIDVRNLSKSFGSHQALKSLSLTIPRGGVFGLIGENGAGKTTLIRHILGLLRPTSGEVRVFGRDPIAHPVEVLGRLGYMSEDRDLPDWMTVEQLMAYSRAFYPSWDDRYAAELVEMFTLDVKARVSSLSRGQRARAALLVALAYRPELLVLDEPSSGLDPVVRRDILGAIIRTIADEGRTVLFSSHLLDEVDRVADRVAMIHRGELVMCGDLNDVRASHRRAVVRFGREYAAAPAMTGAMACEGRGDEWTCLYVVDDDGWRASVESLGGTIVGDEPVTLEEVFIGRTRG